MGVYCAVVPFAFVAVTACSAAAEPTEAQPLDFGCQEMCEQDRGLDGDMASCLTECATWTDLAVPDKIHHAMKRFVQDKSLNEKGGTKMKQASEKAFGFKVGSCQPLVDIHDKPVFDKLDTDRDQLITSEEFVSYGNKMCIPDEMTVQMFSHADTNHDSKLDRHEFLAAGEDTRMESAADAFADPATQGDNEYTEAFMPKFEDWDLNRDGVLEEAEVFNAFMYELSKRDAVEWDSPASKGRAQPSNKEVESEWEDDFERAWPQIDRDGDGVVTRAEFDDEDPTQDLGRELVESAAADEDVADPDGAASASAAPVVLLRGRRAARPSEEGSSVPETHRARGHRGGKQHHSLVRSKRRHVAASVRREAPAASKRQASRSAQAGLSRRAFGEFVHKIGAWSQQFGGDSDQLFNIMDRNRDGHVSSHELLVAMHKIGLPASM